MIHMRGSVRWRAAVILVAGVTTVSVGVGIAQAEGNTPHDRAVRAAEARAAHMPASKASIFMKGVNRAFPTHPANKPTSLPTPSSLTAAADQPAPRVAGISDLRQAPFSQEGFTVTNAYFGKVGGRWYGVYAGTVGQLKPAAIGQGGIYIVSTDAQTNTAWQNLGPFPQSGTTWLKVTSHSGTMLTLVSNTGATYRFDLTTLTYR